MTASSIERVSITLPPGFEPAKHQKKLLTLIAEAHGEGFEIDSIDPVAGTASASRQVAITEVTQVKKSDSFEVRLARGTKPADGDKTEAKLMNQYVGYFMTRFEPFLGKATLTKLTDDEARCRGAVAVALSVKPWEVQVKAAADGGFILELPRTYVGSKHDAKLEEVATTVVGHEGWYVTVNAQRLTGRITPSDPPTFPGTIAYPVSSVKKAPRDKVALGEKLGAPGQEKNDILWLDFEAAPHTQISGTSGSGKSVTLNALITGALAGGCELSIIDLPHKAVDFFWVKEYCRDGGWGCDSLQAAVASVTLTYKEGERRAKYLAQQGVTKWTELPPAEQFKPILLLIDEVTGLIQLDDVPKGISKDHPLVMEAMEANLLRQTLLGYLKKIAAEMRFVGIRMVLSSQVSSVNTGIPTALRMNLANKFLLGSNPTDGNRKLALSDPTSVPKVPDNVRRDQRAARGVGVAELEGKTPAVFKSFYASTDDLARALSGMGLARTSRPSPTASEIARLTPSLEDDGGSYSSRDAERLGDVERAPSGRPAAEVAREMGDDLSHLYGEDGQRLRGFEKANAARAAVVAGAKTSPAAPDGDEW
ncbi:FtsK/SpoIIIE domain-containing protein [Nocardioides sp. InS609-2]|uniref:FtsK/SpoIIIE domain-containing protein n=1 Tax=Nocardioides sp. InS609-2 TaxID=2760705 RepID=UPI0020C01986|nr:FtsK/SpoIIIE domain-containing protein [Nocardioides sp. InS609-2]